MWKETLEKRGIAENVVPKKVQKMIADYREIESGIEEMESEVKNEKDASAKKELNSVISDVRKTLQQLDREIYNVVMLLKLNADGTVATMNASDLSSAWENRLNEFKSKEKKFKTKSIF